MKSERAEMVTALVNLGRGRVIESGRGTVWNHDGEEMSLEFGAVVVHG